MSETNKIIIVVGIVFSFSVNAIMFGWEATRRTADDLVKINNKENNTDILSKKCHDEGGKVVINGYGNYARCDYNK